MARSRMGALMALADALLLAPGLAAGAAILASHLPLGQQVLKRGIIFIDLALAQWAAIGALLVGLWLGDHAALWLTTAGAALFALTGAAVLAWLEGRVAQLEALIGVFYVLAATGALLLLAHEPHGGDLLKRSLSGELLWLDWQGLWPWLLFHLLLALLLWCWPTLLQGRLFFPLFALAITASVPLVGVYLVFTSLVVPALVWRQLASRSCWWRGWLLGVAGYLLGLGVSLWWDWPSGASVVWMLALLALLVAGLRRLFTRGT
jgi:zinc/manganese transport system permease protein